MEVTFNIFAPNYKPKKKQWIVRIHPACWRSNDPSPMGIILEADSPEQAMKEYEQRIGRGKKNKRYVFEVAPYIANTKKGK